MPKIGNKVARELRDQQLVELYASGESIAQIARDFKLSENVTLAAVRRHPKELLTASKIVATIHRRSEALASKIVLKRLESVSDADAAKIDTLEMSRYSETAEREGKQANLAEGLATERTETSQTVNITVATPDTAKAIANGISGGAIQL